MAAPIQSHHLAGYMAAPIQSRHLAGHVSAAGARPYHPSSRRSRFVSRTMTAPQAQLLKVQSCRSVVGWSWKGWRSRPWQRAEQMILVGWRRSRAGTAFTRVSGLQTTALKSESGVRLSDMVTTYLVKDTSESALAHIDLCVRLVSAAIYVLRCADVACSARALGLARAPTARTL